MAVEKRVILAVRRADALGVDLHRDVTQGGCGVKLGLIYAAPPTSTPHLHRVNIRCKSTLAARENFKHSLEQGHAQHDGKKTGRVCKALLKAEPMLWRFMASPGLDLTNNTAERALRPYVIWGKTSFFSQSERGDLLRARVMTVAETCRRLELCAYTLLREVCVQGVRGEAVTIRLPIDDIHSIPASHQIEKRPPDQTS